MHSSGEPGRSCFSTTPWLHISSVEETIISGEAGLIKLVSETASAVSQDAAVKK